MPNSFPNSTMHQKQKNFLKRIPIDIIPQKIDKYKYNNSDLKKKKTK